MDFLQEFEQLKKVTPRITLNNLDNENCTFTNYWTKSKNCYMSMGGNSNEDCHYCYWSQYNKDCVDCGFFHHCELCYEVVDCVKCYNCDYSLNCQNCTDCVYSYNCIGCNSCFGCLNLQHKEYHIFNESVSPEVYKQKVQELLQLSASELWEKVATMIKSLPHRENYNYNVERSSGDYLIDCKNCIHCFDTRTSEDCLYATFAHNTKDNVDVTWTGGGVEDCFSSVSIFVGYNIFCCYVCWNSADLEYCELCFNCKNCLGCVGLHRKEYHILNKPYSKEEYKEKRDEIVSEMKNNNTWGLPLTSCYPYEDTWADVYFPK